MNLSTRTIFNKAFKSSVPVMAGYVVIGIGFGILLRSHGLGLGWAVLMSVFIYSGTMQFVAVDLIASSASLVATAITTLMVSARHLFYSVTMLRQYSKAGKAKPILIWTLTDETYALVCNLDKDDSLPTDEDKTRYALFVSLLNQSYWVFGTALGSILGAAVSYDFAGIDFAMTALFVAVFVSQWEDKKNRIVAITGVVISVACLVIWGADNFLIPTMILIVVVLAAERKLGWVE